MAKAHEFKVGDFARNVESGWLGRIEEIMPPDPEATGYQETMVRMVGVNTLVATIGGKSWDDCIEAEDVQWHSTFDLVPAK